ncbi:MAG: molecular chaperone GrpE [Candidatus Berkelbacteria bacterium Licking1014_7]|uniref:Protein GrpE n=1 Tax=Candidatus Berkelbacteria bacterium Licking1014_7 TaxID=2017147 RepID=A0A554LIL5_9BACT|nr:MAG: molecular chaperone GrpE [Candidatus Berkelbacteria bacterium Licking1014_7]
MQKSKSKNTNQNAKIIKLNLQIQELTNLLQRKQADFENFQKRAEREKQEFVKFSNESLILELLPVLDNLHRSLAQIPDQKNPLFAGVMLVKKQFVEVLERAGVSKIKVNPGDDFNPAFHQAVLQEENKKYSSGKIIGVSENGYILNNRVLRPVKVKVGK